MVFPMKKVLEFSNILQLCQKEEESCGKDEKSL